MRRIDSSLPVGRVLPMNDAPNELHEPPAVLAVPPPGPVKDRDRIDAIDAVRGFALLGIFLVNIHYFGVPFALLIRPTPPEETTTPNLIVHYGVKMFCEGKFYPLFSMLFGMGLVLQYGRTIESGRRFVGTGLRRLLVLMLFGAAHALLLWYGDILFIYSLIGMFVLFFLRCQPRTLFIVAGALLLVAVLAGTGFYLLMSQSASSPTSNDPIPPATAPFADPFGRLVEAFRNDEFASGSGERIWVQTETQAYRNGPYDQLFRFRAVSWLIVLSTTLIGFGWQIAAMFLIGAGLFKAGLFEPQNAHWRRRLFLIGLFIGMPVSVAGALMPRWIPGGGGQIASGLMNMFGGPLLSMAYLGGIATIVDNGWLPNAMRALANTGRMALTNYLTQSLVATTIFYFYGFGLFGKTTAIQRVGIVFAIYIVQVAFSSIWMRRFQFGPMEWLWRTLTYLRLQPMVRRM